VLTLIPWIPDSQVRAGTLYPRGHWGTVSTVPLLRLQRAGVQAGWATPVQLSYRTATACTPLPPCADWGLGWARVPTTNTT